MCAFKGPLHLCRSKEGDTVDQGGGTGIEPAPDAAATVGVRTAGRAGDILLGSQNSSAEQHPAQRAATVCHVSDLARDPGVLGHSGGSGLGAQDLIGTRGPVYLPSWCLSSVASRTWLRPFKGR